MARIDIVIAKLPALIADRTDSLKVETAIRYVGDIIFDASQDRGGDKARALAKVLSAPTSPEEGQSREAILTLFRDGYLDRYVDYTALRDIARAAGISSDLPQIGPFKQEPAPVNTPRVVVLTRMLNVSTASVKAAAEGPERIKSVEALKPSTPTLGNEPTRRLKAPSQPAFDAAADRWVEQKGATTTLEITSRDITDRSPIEFAKEFEETPAGEIWTRGFPCLLGFVPQRPADGSSVEWANPVTGDSFIDHGTWLTSGSPSRLAIRAMLELARADNWTSVAVKGSVRLQSFAEAAAEELELLDARSRERSVDDRQSQARTSSARSKSWRVIRVVGLLASLLVLVEVGFGVAYIYSNPEIQTRLGIKPLVDFLQAKHEESLSAKAPENPLEFLQMTLELSTRKGSALAPPQSEFKDTDLTNARYLRWVASFKNSRTGVEGRDQKIEARFYDPNGVQIASSDASLLIEPGQKNANCTGVALMPPMIDKPAGTYRVALYSGDKLLTQEGFIVNHDLSANNAASAEAPAEAKRAQPCTPWQPCGVRAAAEPAAAAETKPQEHKPDEELATIDERRAKPLQLRSIDFLNTTKTGTALSKATSSFEVSKVLFVGWEVSFENRLYKLEPGQYRVDAAYIGPDGRTLGEVNDYQSVSPSMKTVTFSGRVGNSRGGAFLPGTYTVNFYLNGQFFDARKFQVLADAGGPHATSPGTGSAIGSSGSGSMLGPTSATGTISGLRSGGNPEMELRLRPQPSGYLKGELLIHQSGFGMTPIEGFVRGNHLQFQVPYGTETYYFEGQRRVDQLSGTFESTPSGERGTWTAQAN